MFATNNDKTKLPLLCITDLFVIKKRLMDYGMTEHIATAVIVRDKFSKLYTITFMGSGGPIITCDNLDEGKEEFKEAVYFSSSISNLVYFDDTSKHAGRKKGRKNNINFIELEAA